ncbi:hypothetical protein [Corallococcus sp. EGB]|uniref:hypothetical protein n=1 Tax=Corallococcus sp. EGB TaxID=1521117 RepID=UPI002714B776|nr:hypothetical protein [Corallococcus sp. EGB]
MDFTAEVFGAVAAAFVERAFVGCAAGFAPPAFGACTAGFAVEAFGAGAEDFVMAPFDAGAAGFAAEAFGALAVDAFAAGFATGFALVAGAFVAALFTSFAACFSFEVAAFRACATGFAIAAFFTGAGALPPAGRPPDFVAALPAALRDLDVSEEAEGRVGRRWAIKSSSEDPSGRRRRPSSPDG